MKKGEGKQKSKYKMEVLIHMFTNIKMIKNMPTNKFKEKKIHDKQIKSYRKVVENIFMCYKIKYFRLVKL